MEGLSSRTTMRLVGEFLTLGVRGLWRFIFGYRAKVISDLRFEKMLKDGWSLVRWGDGETAIARGKSISYQKNDEELAEILRNLIVLLPPRTIFGLPWAFTKSLVDKKWNKRFWQIFLSTRVYLDRNFELKSREVIDTEIWYRLYLRLPSLLEELSKTATLILVTGNAEFLSVCPKGTELILVPHKNAFVSFRRTLDFIQCNLDRSKKSVFLLAAGPSSKAFVSHLARDHQVIDIGHGFDFLLRGRGKYAWTR